jgi:2-succinyl-6-hydroxy-2,4-cyclohexadiene-1-carboxylate synthase
MKLTSHQWGTGSIPVTFLHGFTGSAHSFDHLEKHLGHLITATCINLPGHCDSDVSDLNGKAAWNEIVDSVAQLIPRASVLVGYSQGARVALAVALKLQLHVKRLILESASPGIRQRQKRNQRQLADAALGELIQIHGVEKFVDDWEQLPLFKGLQWLDSNTKEALRGRRVAHSSHGLQSALLTMGQGTQPNLWPQLHSLRVPTLLMTGRDDAKYDRLARAMKEEIPLSWHVSLKSCGHAPHLESSERYVSELTNFIGALAHSQIAECIP